MQSSALLLANRAFGVIDEFDLAVTDFTGQRFTLNLQSPCFLNLFPIIGFFRLSYFSIIFIFHLVLLTGIEPARIFQRQILSLLCLPFHHKSMLANWVRIELTRQGFGDLTGAIPVQNIKNQGVEHFQFRRAKGLYSNWFDCYSLGIISS